MKRSLFAIVALVAASALSCAYAVAQSAVDIGIGIYRLARAYGEDLAMTALATVGRAKLDFGKPYRLLLAAQAFVLRQAKRARPSMTAGWRMVPSA